MSPGRIGYTVVRLLFGIWFLGSGLEYFSNLGIQPLGTTPAARDFTLALIASGLFAWVKVVEIVVGFLVLINRAVLAAALACVPVSVIVAYWNFVLEPGVVEWAFGAATLAMNAILLWPYRARIMALLVWRDPLDREA